MSRRPVCRLALLPLLLVMASCRSGTSLSRSQAAGIIKAKQNLPRIETTSIAKKYFKTSRSDDEGSSMPPLCIEALSEPNKLSDSKSALDALRQRGLIEFGIDFVKRNRACTYYYATVSLTAEGRKYLVRETPEAYLVKEYEINFGDVTGIQINEEFKAAQADYTLVVGGVTPFGLSVPDSPMARSANFSLYDDGWRIQN